MAEIDHLVYASPDVDAGATTIHELTGVQAVVGGAHVGRGTHNALLTFDDRTYFEIIGIDPNQPTPAHPRGFGLDTLESPGLVAFAIHPTGDETLEEIAEVISAHGFDPGTLVAMSREKPDGDLLEWRLSTGGDTGHRLGGALPFVIDWLGQPSPATTLPSMGSLTKLAVQHDNAQVGDVLLALGLGDMVQFTVGPAKLSAAIETPTGVVEL